MQVLRLYIGYHVVAEFSICVRNPESQLGIGDVGVNAEHNAAATQPPYTDVVSCVIEDNPRLRAGVDPTIALAQPLMLNRDR